MTLAWGMSGRIHERADTYTTCTCRWADTQVILRIGLSHEQEDEVSSLMMKLSEANEETQRTKRAHTQSEKDRASAELALRSLQQKFDQLTRYGFSLIEFRVFY